MIVDALSGVTSTKGGSLAAVADPEAMMYDSEYLWRHRVFPIVAVQQKYFMRRSDFGPEELVEPIAGFRINRQGSMIRFITASGAAKTGAFVIQIRVDLVALVIVGIWLVWWLPHMLLIGIPRLRAHRRRVSGRCILCAYPVVRPG